MWNCKSVIAGPPESIQGTLDLDLVGLVPTKFRKNFDFSLLILFFSTTKISLKFGPPSNFITQVSTNILAVPVALYLVSEEKGGHCVLETVQDFLIKLGIKPLMHLLEISNFSLNNDLIRLTKIMNNLVIYLKIMSFKVIFQCF